MRKMNEADKRLKSRRTFYLPAELDRRLAERADDEKRSVSNYLTVLLERALVEASASGR
jgi:hypothetical protein